MCLRPRVTRCSIPASPSTCFLRSLIPPVPRNWLCQLQLCFHIKSPCVTFYCKPSSSPHHYHPREAQYRVANEKYEIQTLMSARLWRLYFHISLWPDVSTPSFRSPGWVFLSLSMEFSEIRTHFSSLAILHFPFLISFIPEVSQILCWAVSMLLTASSRVGGGG